MGYEVRRGKHGFRLLWVTYDPKKRVKAIPRESFPAHKFNWSWTFEEADAQAKRLNKVAARERRQAVEAARRVAHEEETKSAFLPPLWLEKFNSIIEEETRGGAIRLATVKKQWQTVQRIIAEFGLEPKEYAKRSAKFYRYFQDQKYSVSYSNQLIRLLNLWGDFVGTTESFTFKKIPKLRGIDRANTVRARKGKRGVRREASPLTFEQLRAVEATFDHQELRPHWNWLFVAHAFGLRPEEVDNLYSTEHTRIGVEGGKEALFIFQTKLTSVEEEQAWKMIPALFPEQRAALKLIKAEAPLQRPLTKTLHRWLGDGYDNYSPRKGFTDWMLDQGVEFQDVAQFLGHQNIDITFKHYKNKRRFKVPKAG